MIDWDDRLQTVKWVPVTVEERKLWLNGSGPHKKKVMEVEAEPAYTASSEGVTNMQLFVSARANYCSFTCETSNINFKNTLIMQPRVHQLVFLLM